MERTTKIMNRLQEHYEHLKTLYAEDQIVGVFLQGSQNYELDYELSDIDTKAIVLPSFDDIVLGHKMASHTHLMENDEHLDAKDIRLMLHTIKKQNINFVEILFTKFKIINPKYAEIIEPLFLAKEAIAHYDVRTAVNCMTGMAYEKRKAMQHPYPATMDKIEKFGYDPKQLHHIARMNYFLKDYIEGKSYEDCLISQHKFLLMNYKKGALSVDKAIEVADSLVEEMKFIKIDFINSNTFTINKEVDVLINDVITKAIRLYLRENI